MLITQAQYNALNADGEYKTPDEDRSSTGYVSTKYYWTQIGQTLTKDDLPTVQKEGNWRWILNSSAMSADGNTISFGSSLPNEDPECVTSMSSLSKRTEILPVDP